MDLPEALWREVIGRLPSQIALLGPDGTIRFTNQRWREFGRENGLVGEDAASLGEDYIAISEAADDEHARRAAAGLRAILSGERSRFALEYPCHCPDEQRWFRMSARPLEFGAERYVVIEHLNITDRKLAELRVREKNDRLEALHGAAAELLQVDSTEAAATLAVTTLEEVLEMPIGAFWLHDADRGVLEPIATTEAAEAVVGDHPTYRGEGSLSWQAFADGRTYVFDDLTQVPDRYNRETPIGSEIILPIGSYGVLNIGATETHAFDETDTTLAAIWAITVTQVLGRIERERELRERKQELMRERDRLEQFASLVSHDLRNPLTIAAGRLEMAIEEHDSEHLPVVDHALDRMERLIDDLLVLAREGEAIGGTEPVRLAELADECWSTVETHHATLDLAVDHIVRADGSRLAQVFENLFRNAVEHGDGAAGITVGELEGECGFFVEDDGTGIPDDERDDAFESGYSTNAEGTGFGLAIVEKIVDAHGWEIVVTEGADGGARFEITGVDLVEE